MIDCDIALSLIGGICLGAALFAFGHYVGWHECRRKDLSDQIWQFNATVEQMSADNARLRHHILDLEGELDEVVLIPRRDHA